jgi:hypothetical protein
MAIDQLGIEPAPDPTFVAISLWSIVHGITSLLLTHPQFPWPDRDELVNHVLSMPILGLLPR